MKVWDAMQGVEGMVQALISIQPERAEGVRQEEEEVIVNLTAG